MSTSSLSSFAPGTECREIDLPSGMHVRAYVRGNGPRTVLFLHGFPELAVSWRGQLAAVPDGFRFVAPDMRGYGGSSAPTEVAAYRMEKLVDDVVELADALGSPTFDLVGHDWGGAVAWQTARTHPQRLTTLSVLNCPPPDVMLRFFVKPAQLRMSWYMFFFQLPWLPEYWLRRDPRRMMMGAFRNIAVNKSVFTPETVAPYIEQLTERGMPGLHYYRAAFRNLAGARKKPPLIPLPTRLIWGLGDGALGPWFADETLYREIATPFDVVTIAESGHWVQQEAVAEVNAALRAHWQR